MNEHVWPLDVFHCGRTGLEHLAPTVANSVRIPLPSIFRRFSGAAIYSGSGASGSVGPCATSLGFAWWWRFFGLRQSYDFDLLVFGLGLRSLTWDYVFSVDFFALVDDFALTVDYDRTFSRRSL